ncbi:MAG: hypothetical protein WA324_27675 [Bryobacteraceae bacterium]
MSLLSSFIAGHVVDSLEKELLSHEPELQEAFLNEVKEFAEVVGGWLKEKLAPKAE